MEGEEWRWAPGWDGAGKLLKLFGTHPVSPFSSAFILGIPLRAEATAGSVCTTHPCKHGTPHDTTPISLLLFPHPFLPSLPQIPSCVPPSQVPESPHPSLTQIPHLMPFSRWCIPCKCLPHHTPYRDTYTHPLWYLHSLRHPHRHTFIYSHCTRGHVCTYMHTHAYTNTHAS